MTLIALVRLFLICTSILAIFTTSSSSAPLEFDSMKSAIKVTFVLNPNGEWNQWEDFKNWDDGPLNKSGCLYSTDNPLKIGTLVEILKRGGFEKKSDEPSKIASKSKYYGDIREGIYFTYTDGVESRLLLSGYLGLGTTSPESKSTKMQVSRTSQASNYYEFFYAKDSLPWLLMFWASTLSKPEVNDPQSEKKCNTVMRYYINGAMPD